MRRFLVWFYTFLIVFDLIILAVSPVALYWLFGKDWILLCLVVTVTFVSAVVIGTFASFGGD